MNILAILVIAAYLLTVILLSNRYHELFRLWEFGYWNLAIVATILTVVVLLYRSIKSKLVLVFAGLVAALIPFSYLIQEQATINVSQRMSIDFIVDHIPVFAPLLPQWVLPAVVAGFIVVTALLYFAFGRLVARARFSIVAFSTIIPTVLLWSAALVFHPGQQGFLGWDPMLGLFGYPQSVTDGGDKSELLKAERAALEQFESTEMAPDLRKQNVIIFMSESLNPEHLQEFGYRRRTMPFLDELKQKTPHYFAYEARANCAESICAVLSTFASRRFKHLPPFETLGLGTVLRKAGYDIHFILVGDHRRYSYGAYTSFLNSQTDTIHDFTTSAHAINDDAMVLEGLEKLPEATDRPALVFVFFMTPHSLGKNYPEFAKFGDFLGKSRPYFIFREEHKNGFPRAIKRAVRRHYDNKLFQLSHFMRSGFAILEKKDTCGITSSSSPEITGKTRATGVGWDIGN